MLINRKIVLVTWRSQPGGIEVLLPLIAKHSNGQFSVYTMRNSSDERLNVYSNLTIPIQYGTDGKISSLWNFFRFSLKHRRSTFHVFNLGPYGLLVLSLAGIHQVIYSIRGTIYWSTLFQKVLRKIAWYFTNNRHIIFIANSQWSKKRFLEQISDKPDIKVIYNPIDVKRFNAPVKDNEFPVSIIYSGRLTKGKNLHRWLDCARQISKLSPTTSFIIYGEGPLLKELKNFAKQLKIADRVTFFGFKKDIENAYKDADLLIFLSEYESFGNVVVESILCGTPVIVSRIPSMEEIFTNYPEFLVPLDENLVQNVLNKIENYSVLKETTRKAKIEFMERFSLEKHIQALEEIYHRFD